MSTRSEKQSAYLKQRLDELLGKESLTHKEIVELSKVRLQYFKLNPIKVRQRPGSTSDQRFDWRTSRL